MWIVLLGDDTRHSAWSSKSEALHQAEVLYENGYIGSNTRDFVIYDRTVQCKNGHYYV